MAKVSAVMLAVILAVGLGFVVARGASPPEHVYTVPQVLASLRALRGRTVLVRGVLVYGWVWGPRSALRPCQQSCGPIIYALEGAFPFGTPLLVFVGAQDPILALLREVHVLPPF